MTVELVERGGRLMVRTPHNIEWSIWAVAHDAKWDPVWMARTFHPDQRAAVEAALAEIFGGDDDE